MAQKCDANWPISACPPVHEVSETRTSFFSFLTVTIEKFFTRYSSLRKLQRVIAHIFHFNNNVKTSIAKNELQTGPLTVEELQRAINSLVKLAQRHSFKQEVNDLKSKRSVNLRSLFDLHLFIDENEVIRVGGRLRNSRMKNSFRLSYLRSIR